LDIKFIKLHNCGKDFILFDNLKNKVKNEKVFCDISKKITNRNLGVGGMGLIVLSRTEAFSAKIYYEGSEIEMTPEALLCTGRYAFDSGYISRKQNGLITKLKTYKLNMIDSRNIAVNLGPPNYWDKSLEIVEDPDLNLSKSIEIEGKKYTYTPLTLMDFHVSFFVENFDFNFNRLSRQISSCEEFPSIPFIEFIQVFSREEIRIKTREPGKTGNIASGSGSCAAAIVSVILGFTDREIIVHNRGGDYIVNWNVDNNNVYLTGPVDYTFTGNYYHNTASKNNNVG
jgi:diaminopimelate epimerase